MCVFVRACVRSRPRVARFSKGKVNTVQYYFNDCFLCHVNPSACSLQLAVNVLCV